MKKTILVVDDFASIRDFICDTLQRKGYNTQRASNGNEAYNLLIQNPTDIQLVLSDYNMPDCTGFELLKKIKQNPATAKVAVVFLTTESNVEKMRSARDAGLSAWIRKPYQSESFFATLENAMLHG